MFDELYLGPIPNEYNIKNSGLIIFPVSKKEVNNLDFNRIDLIIKNFNKCGKNGKEKLMITFDYDDVKEEIYEIPEVRKYIENIFKNHPNIFYFISNLENLRNVIIACLCDISMQVPMDRNVDIVTVSLKLSGEIKRQIAFGLLNYGSKINEDLVSLNLSSFK